MIILSSNTLFKCLLLCAFLIFINVGSYGQWRVGVGIDIGSNFLVGAAEKQSFFGHGHADYEVKITSLYLRILQLEKILQKIRY